MDFSFLKEKVQDDTFAQHLYAALCNVQWQPVGAVHEPRCELTTGELGDYRAAHVTVSFINEHGLLDHRPPELTCTCNAAYSCSWRYAGELVAGLRSKGEDYLDFYCSGGEGKVAPEVREAFAEIGWEPLEGETELFSINFAAPDKSGGETA